MNSNRKSWIGVDFDGTLAHYDTYKGPGIVGKPIEKMVKQVKAWLDVGVDVKIFTARIYPLNTLIPANVEVASIVEDVEKKFPELDARMLVNAAEDAVAIRKFCKQHLGRRLDITNVKDHSMVVLYDDRAVRVDKNRGTF